MSSRPRITESPGGKQELFTDTHQFRAVAGGFVVHVSVGILSG